MFVLVCGSEMNVRVFVHVCVYMCLKQNQGLFRVHKTNMKRQSREYCYVGACVSIGVVISR